MHKYYIKIIIYSTLNSFTHVINVEMSSKTFIQLTKHLHEELAQFVCT